MFADYALEESLVDTPIRSEQSSHLIHSFGDLKGRIAVLGGSFDPFHIAHLRIIESVLATNEFDSVVIMPAKQNPDKIHRPLFTEKERLFLIEEAIQGLRNVWICDFELSSIETKSYSADTFSILRPQIPPGSTLTMILGADCLKTLPSWHRAATLLDAIDGLVVMTRPGYDQDEPQSILKSISPRGEKIKITIPQDFHYEVSSTDIRDHITPDRIEEIRSIIPPSAWEALHQLVVGRAHIESQTT